MNNLNLIGLAESAPTSPVPTVSVNSEATPSLLDPAVLKPLGELAPLTLVCVTVCVASYFGIQLMEQFNRFIELLVKKK